MNLMHFLRMAKWARQPPSRKRLMATFAALGLVAALALIEYFVGWPEALTLDPARSRPLR